MTNTHKIQELKVNAEKIEKTILLKLFRDGYIGGRHTSEDNVPKGFKSHLRGDVKKALRKLHKKGYLIVKPTSYGTHISLEPKKVQEIINMAQD